MEKWHKGEQIKYTGKSEILHGARFFQVQILTGHEKAEIKDTTLCPDCGMYFGQDKRLPCFTCNVETNVTAPTPGFVKDLP